MLPLANLHETALLRAKSIREQMPHLLPSKRATSSLLHTHQTSNFEMVVARRRLTIDTASRLCTDHAGITAGRDHPNQHRKATAAAALFIPKEYRYTGEQNRSSHDGSATRSRQIKVFVVFDVSGLNHPLDPEAHVRFPRVELRDLQTDHRTVNRAR